MDLSPDDARAIRMHSLLLTASATSTKAAASNKTAASKEAAALAKAAASTKAAPSKPPAAAEEQADAETAASPKPEGTGPVDAAAIVEWFGAMQAQDIASGLWSLGTRLRVTRTEVEAEIERAAVLRTWPMRGTIHFVPSRDARWMLALTGSRTWQAFNRRRAELGLDDDTVTKAFDVLGNALAGGGRMTRAHALELLNRNGIDTAGQRAYFLLMGASLHGITCIAPHVGREQTFALLDDWAARPRHLDRAEALHILTGRYFASHGPVRDKDFAGWTGLSLTEARHGIAGHDLVTVRVDGVEMLLRREDLDGWSASNDIVVLPGFDEYLLGYKDRSLMATPAQLQAIVPGNNGVFQSTVVRHGKVVAIWKRTAGKKSTIVNVTTFGRAPRAAIVDAFAPYQAYLEQPVQVRFTE